MPIKITNARHYAFFIKKVQRFESKMDQKKDIRDTAMFANN